MLTALLNSGDLITPSELAKGLKVSRAAVSQWCKAGKLPFLQIEKCIRFSPEQIREWLKARERAARKS
ncbi:MAG: helix-turn-helix domain-containing protein [Deltaproteobacteria bacterium]|nr:helix-turn-helix domain-containing protein [Deltaproteobacteria bacterium]